MPKLLTLQESYKRCVTEGKILPQDNSDFNRIQSMMLIAKDDVESAKVLLKHKDQKYGSIYKLYYDALHQYAEALLLFNKVKSYNHHCLFSYLCTHYPELELDWNFFENVRTKRNGIQYYGDQIDKNEWREIQLQLEMYIKIISETVEKNIKIHKY